MIEQSLREYGLNENEIRIYLTLLKRGPSPSSILGKHTGIQRNSAKYACLQLVKKGLLSFVEKNNTFIYSPEPPEVLVQKLHFEKKAIEEKMNNMDRVVSELKKLVNPQSTLPTVKFFEGKDAYIQFSEETLKCKKKEILFLTDMDKFRSIVSEKYDTKTFIPRRIEKGIHIRILTNKSKLTQKMQLLDKSQKRSIRFLPPKYPVAESMYVYDDVTMLISNVDYPSCVMIRSSEITTMMRSMFENMWATAEQ